MHINKGTLDATETVVVLLETYQITAPMTVADAVYEFSKPVMFGCAEWFKLDADVMGYDWLAVL